MISPRSEPTSATSEHSAPFRPTQRHGPGSDEREHSGAHCPFPTRRLREQQADFCDGSSALEGVFVVARRLGSA
jgi:hypothetical protein